MHRLTRALVVAAAVALLAIGCSSDRNALMDNNGRYLANAMYTIPAGANLVSATFYINVTQFSNQPVNIYRVTADWDEMTVTWNSFAGAYDPTLEGTFQSDGMGWRSADVTDLVYGWLTGTYPNFGLLIDQPDVYYTVSTYSSREATENMPAHLEVCYEVNGSTTCLDMIVEKDAYIRQYYPDLNWGDIEYLASGWGSEEYLEKQSLLRFDFEMAPPDDQVGCTRTIGYWKTHAGFGPQDNVVSQYLPIWLGTPNGDKSLLVSDSSIAHDVLSQDVYCNSHNGITKLYAQLLAARLNEAAGADITDIAEALDFADAFLADHDCTDWSDLSRRKRKKVLHVKDKFDSYNNGEIGPGHCDDGTDGGDDGSWCDGSSTDHEDDGEDDGYGGRRGHFKCDKDHDHEHDRGNCDRFKGDD